MQNMSEIYKGHNRKITSTLCNQLTLCNYRVKDECPMDDKFQTMDAVYVFRITSPEPRNILLWVGRRKMEEKVL